MADFPMSPEEQDAVDTIHGVVKDLVTLVQAYRAGQQLGVPAAMELEIDSVTRHMNQDPTYPGELLGAAVAFIASPEAREYFNRLGLELGE